MVRLKADPWRADHTPGAEIGLDESLSKPVVDEFVETEDWARPLRPAPCPPESMTFVDGVMRTEMRVLASDGDRRAWGLLGSCAAGAVRCDGTAQFVAEDVPVRRALVLGGRLESPPVELDVRGHPLTYAVHAVADDSPTGLRIGLQRLMLREEQELASALSGNGLIFADGPLHLDGNGEDRVIGVVKRMVKAYLENEPASLLPHLRPGERTPLFGLGNNVLDRFAWYLRLIDSDPTWHEYAGLVRCEVRMTVGLEEAKRIADLTACHLPAFAGRPGVDPRAPQNLTPVGALEARLKHRLGSSTLITRAFTQHIAEANDGG